MSSSVELSRELLQVKKKSGAKNDIGLAMLPW